MCWAIIGSTTQNPPLVRSCGTKVGLTTVIQLLKITCWTKAWTMSARQQWRVANNSNHFPTLAQRLLAILERTQPVFVSKETIEGWNCLVYGVTWYFDIYIFPFPLFWTINNHMFINAMFLYIIIEKYEEYRNLEDRGINSSQSKNVGEMQCSMQLSD